MGKYVAPAAALGPPPECSQPPIQHADHKAPPATTQPMAVGASGVVPTPCTCPPIDVDRPRPKKVGVNDIITVIIDENSEVKRKSKFNRTRSAIDTAQRSESLQINGSNDLDLAAGNTPGINGQLGSQLQSTEQGLTWERMKYSIAARVVDILPNGTLILEGHKSIRSNTELWEYSLTGRIRSQDVVGNSTVNSENIADLTISKRETGKNYESTKRGFINRFFDSFRPF